MKGGYSRRGFLQLGVVCGALGTVGCSAPLRRCTASLEREHQQVPDLIIHNQDSRSHEVTITVSKRPRDGATSILFEETYKLPEEAKREVSILFEKAGEYPSNADYRARFIRDDDESASIEMDRTLHMTLRYLIDCRIKYGGFEANESHVDADLQNRDEKAPCIGRTTPRPDRESD